MILGVRETVCPSVKITFDLGNVWGCTRRILVQDQINISLKNLFNLLVIIINLPRGRQLILALPRRFLPRGPIDRQRRRVLLLLHGHIHRCEFLFLYRANILQKYHGHGNTVTAPYSLTVGHIEASRVSTVDSSTTPPQSAALHGTQNACARAASCTCIRSAPFERHTFERVLACR